MALFDAMFEFSDAQAITASAQSTNVLDLQAADLEMGAGTPIWLNVRVGTADFAGGTSLKVTFYACSTATTISNGSDLLASDTIAQASLTAGAWIIRVPLPVNFDEDRYIGLYYTDTGGFTAEGNGTINGNLYVNGDLTYVKTEEVQLDDNELILNANNIVSGTNTDGGFVVQRVDGAASFTKREYLSF